ncbi:MAG: hypothetical protein MI807_02455 [Verrucomicrobiales bacterium]|nr:hypothetical protein [Verrucomicrobiales bacterium]
MSEIPESSAARRLTAYSYLVAFANDGTLDEAELQLLEKMALEDGVIDEEEKRVLELLFNRVSKETVSEAVWKEINRFRDEHDIG